MKKSELRKVIRQIIKEQAVAPMKGDRPCLPGEPGYPGICGVGGPNDQQGGGGPNYDPNCWNDSQFAYNVSPLGGSVSAEAVASECYQQMYTMPTGGGQDAISQWPNNQTYTCCMQACIMAYQTPCQGIGPMIGGSGPGIPGGEPSGGVPSKSKRGVPAKSKRRKIREVGPGGEKAPKGCKKCFDKGQCCTTSSDAQGNITNIECHDCANK